MKNYKKVILLSLFLLSISSLVILLKDIHFKNKEKEHISIIENIEVQEKNKQEEGKTEEINDKRFEDEIIGILVIPSIEVKAVIKEGTSQEILKYTIRAF